MTDGKRPKKPHDFTPIGTILKGALGKYRRRDAEMTRVWDLWDASVDGMIAENARPAAFKGDLLLIHVESATWIQDLQFIKEDLIRTLNQALGKPLIRDIKFKVGPLI